MVKKVINKKAEKYIEPVVEKVVKEKKKKVIRHKVDDFSSLEWVKVKNIKGDASNNLIEGYVKGDFNRMAVKQKLQSFATHFHKTGKQARIGVALRYKNAKSWCPAYLTDCNPVDCAVYDPSDSSKGRMYDNDTIDAICFYVLEGHNVDNSKPIMRKPKQVR